MLIQPTIEPRKVIDYDITFLNGTSLPITIDEHIGDAVDWDTSPLTVTFKQAARPHSSNPEASTPEQEITIFVNHIVSIIKRQRSIMPATPDQQEEWKDILRSLKVPLTVQ